MLRAKRMSMWSLRGAQHQPGRRYSAGGSRTRSAPTSDGKGRILRILALSYVVKTILVALVWLAIPDLPQRTAAKVREAWSLVTQR